VDWRIYHTVNSWSAAHGGIAHAVDVLMTALVVAIVVAAVCCWFAARPDGGRRWKLAAAGGLVSGAVAFAVNQLIGAFWDRPRAYETHAGVWHPYAQGTDKSFPSDHASAAFGIAWGVFLVDRAAGALFLLAAAVLSWSRVVIGAHYPGDVGAGVLVGLGAALLVVRLARPLLVRLVALVERITDPVVRPLWRRAAH
jgi:undecaprenyl-diphosphatase